MGKFGDWLFASGGKKPDSFGPGDYQEMLNNNPFYKQLLGQLGEGIEPYGGQLAAGPSHLQQLAFSQIPGMGNTPSARMRQMSADLLAAGVPAFGASSEEYEKYYETGVKAPAMREWQEETIPYLQHAYGSHNAGSGEFIDQLGDSAVDLQTNLASQKAEIGLRGLERGQDELAAARDRSIPGIASSAQEETRPIRYGLAGGDVQRGIQQDYLTGEFYRWAMAQPWANPWFSMVGGGGGGSNVSMPGFIGGDSGLGPGLTGIGNLLSG